MPAKAAAIAIALAISAFPAGASAGPSVQAGEWAATMARDLGFEGGLLLREDYRARGDAYLDIQSSYIGMLHEPILRRVGYDRHLSVIVAGRMQDMYAAAESYVRSVEEGIFRLLDPDGDGKSEYPEALGILAGIASRADLDGDGRLDPGEAKLAEAALARGEDLADPAVKHAMVYAFTLGFPEY